MEPIARMDGDSLPVSAFVANANGEWEQGASAYEKRGTAVNVPEWDASKCVGCNQCAFVCSHATIRPFQLTADELAAAPAQTKSRDNRPANEYKFVMAVSPLDCMGCGECVTVCPTAAIEMKPQESQSEQQAAFDYCVENIRKKDNIPGVVSEVSVNGKPAGSHEGAFTAFCYEITPLLKKGSNTISVLVDNTQRNHIAPQRGDFSMFGGLYRPIELIETDGVCIDPLFYASPGVFITAKSLSKSKAEVEVKTLLNSDGKAGDVDVAVEILDMKGRKVAGKTVKAAAGEKNRLEVPVTLAIANPVLWNGVKNPYLYQVKTSIRTADGQTDELVQPLGLRTVSVNPKEGFVLNGKTMQIKGVSRHQDMKGKGWALSPEDEARDIRLIADMGADGVRTGHYPASTNIYDLCDKAGLIVWSEVPNVNLVWDTPEFRENNRLQAREMIFQHWNHPSICMWGIFNEIGHQPEAATRGVDMEAELTELNKFVKETDPSRMTVGPATRRAAEN